jgi:hypothetical protein
VAVFRRPASCRVAARAPARASAPTIRVDLAPLADHDEERDRPGGEADGKSRVGINIDLDNLQPSGVPAGEVLNPV